MGLFDNLRRGIGQVPTNARSRGGMGGIFGNLMDRQRRSSILPKQPQSFAEFQQMQKEGSLFGGQLNPAPMDPSGTFQMGFGNMVPDAQTLEQLQQGIPGIPQIENGIIPIGSPDPRQIPSIGLPPLKRAIDAPGGGGIDYGGGSIDKILEDQILEDQRGGMRPPQQGMGPPLGEDDNRQGMGPPQQLLPPPPGFTPPTIGNPDGSGRDMGIAPPSFGGGRPPLAPPAMQQPVAPLAPPPLVPQGPQPIPMLPNETSVPFLPPMAPPKRNDFMSIAQDPNQRLNEDRDKQRALLQAQNIDMTGGLGSNNFGGVNLGGTPINSLDGIQGRQGNNPPVRSLAGSGPTRTGADFVPKSTSRQGMSFQPAVAVNPQPAPFVPPQQPAFTPLSERTDIYGEGKKYDPANLPEGFSYDSGKGMYSAVMPSMGNVYAYGPDGQRREVASGEPGAAELRDQGAARDQAYLDFQKTNPGEVFRDFGGLRPPPPSTPGIGGMGGQPNPSDLFGGIPGEPEPINFGQPPVNPGTAPVPPPATNGMPPVPGGLMDPADLEVNPGVTTDPATTGGVQERPNMVDPVLQNQTTSETISDPLLRQLYFGTEDNPGFYNQLQQAGANLIGTDVPLQDTAGLDPLQSLARQQAQEGLGQFQPYFDQQQGLVNEAIGQSRRAEDLQDPYFDTAEQQIGLGLDDSLGGIGEARNLSRGTTGDLSNRLGDIESQAAGNVGQFGQALGGIGGMAMGATDEFGNRLGESEDLLRGTLGGYDQNMTSQFYNPYEDAVVNQTIQDVMDAGDKQDISARAQGISSGGESAFGSRARLGADERREALGRGLGKALSGIRSQGFQQAQQTGMSEFARQKAAQSAAASGLGQFAGSRLGANQQLGGTLRGLSSDQLAAQQGLTNQLTSGAQSRYGAGSNLASNLQQYGQGSSAARQNMASGMLGIGQQRGAGANALGSNLAAYGNQMGNIGSNVEQLRRGQRSELSGMGMDNRSISEQENLRRYQQQLSQQLRPLQTVQGIGALLPGYQASSTNIGSQYGMADDPTAKGLGSAFSAYGSLVPRSS